MICCDMMIQLGSGTKIWLAVLAFVRENSIEMNILYMLPQIAPIVASFSTENTFVWVRSTSWVLHNVIIELLVPTWNRHSLKILTHILVIGSDMVFQGCSRGESHMTRSAEFVPHFFSGYLCSCKHCQQNPNVLARFWQNHKLPVVTYHRHRDHELNQDSNGTGTISRERTKDKNRNIADKFDKTKKCQILEWNQIWDLVCLWDQ